MKTLDWNEFQERIEITAKARKIFIPHITKNITVAFDLYQEVLAKEQMAVTISKINTPFGNIERPLCDVCDSEMQINTRPQTVGDKIYPTSWICPKCKIQEYSEKTPQEWIEELKIED